MAPEFRRFVREADFEAKFLALRCTDGGWMHDRGPSLASRQPTAMEVAVSRGQSGNSTTASSLQEFTQAVRPDYLIQGCLDPLSGFLIALEEVSNLKIQREEGSE